MGKTWKIHPKHRKKGTFKISVVNICRNCEKRKVSKYHHFLCEVCGNEKYKKV